jgi:hypothetical protein
MVSTIKIHRDLSGPQSLRVHSAVLVKNLSLSLQIEPSKILADAKTGVHWSFPQPSAYQSLVKTSSRRALHNL